MSARVARETFEVERVVARIYDPRRAAIYQRLGIPTVATVSWTTDQVMRRLLPGEHPADWTDAQRRVSLVERDLPNAWAGQQLSKLNEPGRFLRRRGHPARCGAGSPSPTSSVRKATSCTSWSTPARVDALQARLSGDDDAVRHH